MPTMTIEVPAELAERIERAAAAAGRSKEAEVLHCLDTKWRPLPPAERLPTAGDWPADAPNEEDTRIVNALLQPAWDELRRRQPGIPVPVVQVGGPLRVVGPFTTGDAPGDEP